MEVNQQPGKTTADGTSCNVAVAEVAPGDETVRVTVPQLARACRYIEFVGPVTEAWPAPREVALLETSRRLGSLEENVNTVPAGGAPQSVPAEAEICRSFPMRELFLKIESFAPSTVTFTLPALKVRPGKHTNETEVRREVQRPSAAHLRSKSSTWKSCVFTDRAL